jgi:uncharacterized protein (TIGR03083 family)
MAKDPWRIIHAERSALARDLAKLRPAQWETQSLCSLWTVRDVVGHLTATAKMTPGSFVRRLLGSGFRFDAMAAKDVSRETAGTTAQLLEAFRRHVGDSTGPPGPAEAMLGEIILHGQDIRRPLRMAHAYPTDAVVRVADFYKRPHALVGVKRRTSRLRLRATDVNWSYGSGPEVSGPVLSLALAMTGRAVALDDLSGEGLDTLRDRF